MSKRPALTLNPDRTATLSLDLNYLKQQKQASAKVPVNLFIQGPVLRRFRKYCKETGLNMSEVVQNFMVVSVPNDWVEPADDDKPKKKARK